MVYSNSSYRPSLVELARAGNFRAIAQWLNQSLLPYGIRAFVGAVKPGCLKILLEFQPIPEHDALVGPWREALVRFICHQIWQLNSALIEGVRVAARFAGDRSLLWEQSVKIATPARHQKRQQSQQLRTQIRQTARQKARLKTMRALLMSGSTVFAFVFGGVLAYVKAPVEQSNAVPSPQPKSSNKPSPNRSDTVKTALETVPVVKHNRVENPADPTVTLMFSGDVTLAESFADEIGSDYKWAFAEFDEYRQADLAMVNLENPLTKSTLALPDKQFNFKADPDSVKVLTEGGVDLVTLGNNHTMDYQEEGLVETMNTLDQSGILHMGAGRDVTEARRPEIVDIKGQRIAFLGYYGADLHAATDKGAGTNYADETRISEDIKAIRNQVDWIVVNYHWGEEKASHPADWQVELAHFTIDQGADVVVGHHPHVLQGAEIYKGRPIAYSLGNFIFGGNSRSDYDTAVLKVAVKDKQMKVEFLPVEVQKYQAKAATGERGQAILQQIADLSSGFQQPMQSPMVLEAYEPSQVESPLPSGLPSNSNNGISPSVPNSPTDTDPAVPLDNYTEPSPPAPSQLAPTPDVSPTPTDSAPEDAQSPTESSQPTDPFTDSGNRTPFTTPSDSPSPQDSTPVQPVEPQLPNFAPLDPGSAPSPSPSAFVPSQNKAMAHAPSPVQRPPKSVARKASASPQPNPQAAWSTPGEVGETLIPDVSLMAATVW